MGRSDGDPKGKQQVRSRQWSCSELKDGHQKLLAVKTESAGKAQVDLEIEETGGSN